MTGLRIDWLNNYLGAHNVFGLDLEFKFNSILEIKQGMFVVSEM